MFIEPLWFEQEKQIKPKSLRRRQRIIKPNAACYFCFTVSSEPWNEDTVQQPVDIQPAPVV